MTNHTIIEVKIGTWECTYLAMRTKAPREYDGFGTINIYPDDPPNVKTNGGDVRADDRLVLIEKEHQEWQLGRYGSGLYECEPVDGLDQYVQQQLFDRIRGTS